MMANSRWLSGATLWLLNMGFALAVVVVSFNCRLLADELMDLKSEQQRLQVEWGRLLLEESALAANVRVEQVARSELAMKRPAFDQIRVIGP